MRGCEPHYKTVHAAKRVNPSGGDRPSLDALVFVMLRCLRAFDPYGNENTVLGEVLSCEGSSNPADLWKASVVWGVREIGFELCWPDGKEWLQQNVEMVARGLLANPSGFMGVISAV